MSLTMLVLFLDSVLMETQRIKISTIQEPETQRMQKKQHQSSKILNSVLMTSLILLLDLMQRYLASLAYSIHYTMKKQPKINLICYIQR